MFQRNKINHEVVVYCTDGVNEATYTIIESYDEHWGDIATQRFFEEFGTKPLRIERISYVAI